MSTEVGTAAAAGHAIEIEKLVRRFGDKIAVDALDLRVRAGEIYGFLGPNGAGKTTTIRIATGLLRPTSGTVRILGMDVSHEAAAAKRVMGVVPDTPPLYEFLTAREYAAFVASLWDVDREEAAARREELFEHFEIAGSGDQLCRALSFGTRKKLHLCAVLATGPRVLFLDEPTVGLDPRSARRLEERLVGAKRDGLAILLTTHLLDLAQRVSDRVGILSEGRLLAEGTVADLERMQGARGLAEVFLRLTEEDERHVKVEGGDAAPHRG